RDAVVAGAGIAALPGIVARPDIAAGRLVRVLPDWSTPRKAIYFVYPSAQSVTARLRAFIDHLARAMGDD
ncbi:MAG TPA: LysR substrate-binding domain-containing protein, partial [Tabrizicola sp.]|nr:LysR substrate-binding domain-containing protein [Tabrizicola sp.]